MGDQLVKYMAVYLGQGAVASEHNLEILYKWYVTVTSLLTDIFNDIHGC